MVSYKLLLPGLALCLLIDELYAFLLPDRLRLAKSGRRLSRDASSPLSELTDLAEFMPDNGGEMTQDWEPKPAKSFSVLSTPSEYKPPPPKPQRRNNLEKSRVRVTVPLDRIGNSYLSSRSRKDEPEDNRPSF